MYRLLLFTFIILLTNNSNLIYPITFNITGDNLKEGKWIYRGRKNIIGAGFDRIIEIKKLKDKIVLQINEIQYFSIDEKRKPKITIKGPYNVKVIENILTIESPNEIDVKTFRYEGELLVWPALIRLDEKTWYIKSNNDEYTFMCENNPEVMNQGKATFSSSSSENTGWSQYYSLTSNNTQGSDRSRVLLFYEKYKDDKTYENGLR